LLDDANAAAQIATLGLDADIATLSLPASTTITAAGAALLDDANAAAQLATLGALPLAGGTMSGNIVMGDGGTIGQAAGPLLTFDDTNNELEITGANVGIGVGSAITPATPLDLNGIMNIRSSGIDGTPAEQIRFGYVTCTGTGNWRNSIYSSVSTSPALSKLVFSLANARATQVDVLFMNGAGNVGIGTLAPLSELCINGGLHVGGDSDAGDNNLLVDGTGTITGGFGCNSKTAQTGYANAPWDEPGAGQYGVDSAAHMAALVELVQDIQAALVANGILATPA
jgi:hypothetical protein